MTGVRDALQAIVDLPTVVPDHPHGGVHPPYLEWRAVVDIARAALDERDVPADDESWDLPGDLRTATNERALVDLLLAERWVEAADVLVPSEGETA